MDLDVMSVVAALFVIATLYTLFKRFSGDSKNKTPEASPSRSLDVGKGEEKDEDDGDKKPLKIFFGSQTGTAEDFANTLCDEGLAYGFAPEVIDLEEFDLEDMADTELALFCLATYGEGEPTDNARSFYTWMKEEEHDEEELEK